MTYIRSLARYPLLLYDHAMIGNKRAAGLFISITDQSQFYMLNLNVEAN